MNQLQESREHSQISPRKVTRTPAKFKTPRTRTMKTGKKTRIVIAGGGFAGLYAAKQLDGTLAQQKDVEVTLISRENFILFTPMLHEVAAGDLSPSDIVNPLRRILSHVNVVQGEIYAIDVAKKKVRCLGGLRDVELEFEFDHLLLALGAETNFFGIPGVRDWAVTMKSLADAALLRNRMVALLEEASLHNDRATQRELLTFITAGGGFSGAETTGAINDFLRETARFYPGIKEEIIRIVLVHAGEHILPELGKELGRYAEQKLRNRGVEVIDGALVTSYDGSTVEMNNGRSIPAATLIWTAGAKPSPVIEGLPWDKQRGRLLVDECLAVAGVPGLWAVGDCAAVPDGGGGFYPPTAQHAMREAVAAAKNIARAVVGEPLKPFHYKTIGMLASIGHHSGVAMLFGIKFSGFIAWWMWRSVYLLKLPRLAKKIRVMMDWTLDLLFGRDIEQAITLRDIEAAAEQIGRVRARRNRTPIPPQPKDSGQPIMLKPEDDSSSFPTTLASTGQPQT
jgi:NADH:ubiquinone reductase (H+-translocating)